MTRLLWCTLPCWRTLTLLHFSALIGQPCKPPPPACMWGSGLSKQPSVWAILFWLGTARKPSNMSAAHHGPVYCVVQTFARWTPWAILLTEDNNIQVSLWKRGTIYIHMLKMATCGISYDRDNDKAIQSRQQALDIPQDCVVCQGAI